MDDRHEVALAYEFGDFHLDANRRVIQRPAGGRRLVLQPRVFEAALYFVRHPGQLLSKERLLDELWPGMVVEENCLAQVVSMLRRALGEDRGENRYIVTVPRRGYRFVAAVACVADRADSSQPGEITVAVLPFHNLSARADDGRMAAGIVESTLHRLAGVQGVRLLAHSRPGSRGGPDDPGYLERGFARHGMRRWACSHHGGRWPEPRFCVEGSLQRAGARLRVMVKLVDASDDTLVWSQVLDRTSGDVFAVEDEVARRVTAALLQCLSVQARCAGESSPGCAGTAEVA